MVLVLSRPTWLQQQSKKGQPISYFSLDIHPSGDKFATGSIDSAVRIWQTRPCLDITAEADPNVARLLSTVRHHDGAVMCVRWSNGQGEYLASGSDDQRVLLCVRDKSGQRRTFGEVNEENYFVKHQLMGHRSDVSDVAWSPDNSFLASCAFDGTILIWGGSQYGRLYEIQAHQKLVKGLAWDPVGKYLASQSDDNTMRIWRSSDWGLEKEITEPFVGSHNVTLFKRPSWSPEGSLVASANAMNGLMHVSVLVMRGEWNCDLTLVGHSDAVQVTAFHPHILYIPDHYLGSKAPWPATKPRRQHMIVALGSTDGSVSIFSSGLPDPIFAVRELFKHSVVDLKWAPDGRSLFVCSYDGTINVLSFDTSDLGEQVPQDELTQLLNQYGFQRGKAPPPPETTLQLDLEKLNHRLGDDRTPQPSTALQRRIGGLAGATSSTLGSLQPHTLSSSTSSTIPHFTSSSNAYPPGGVAPGAASGPSALPPRQTPVITKDGKKRLQPIFVASFDTQAESPFEEAPGQLSVAALTLAPPPPSLPQSSPISRDSSFPLSLGSVAPSTDKDSRVAPGASFAYPIVELPSPPVQPALYHTIADPSPPMSVNSPHAASLEAKNDSTKGISLVKCCRGDQVLWLDTIIGNATLLSGSRNCTSVCCQDGSLLVYSKAGRRLLPPIQLSARPSHLDVLEWFVMVVDHLGNCRVWNVETKTITLSTSLAPILFISSAPSEAQANEADAGTGPEAPNTPAATASDDAPNKLVHTDLLSATLTPHGAPLITTTVGSWIWNANMQSWFRIASWTDQRLFADAFGNGLDLTDEPRSLLAPAVDTAVELRKGVKTPVTNGSGKWVKGFELTWLESQLNIALARESLVDYLHYLKTYARKLVDAGVSAQNKVSELLHELSGPDDGNDDEDMLGTDFDPHRSTLLMGVPRADLLKQILPILSGSRHFQRTVGLYARGMALALSPGK